MHINLELLECVYLTSAMLMEIPWMAGMLKIYNKKKIHSFPNSKAKYIVPLPFFVSIVSTVAPLVFPSFFPHCLPSRR